MQGATTPEDNAQQSLFDLGGAVAANRVADASRSSRHPNTCYLAFDVCKDVFSDMPRGLR